MAKLLSLPKPASLFPILPSGPTGIARLAAEALHADDGHLIEFRAMEARSLLNKTVSKRGVWMAYSINPYRGCEFGCKYCYARYTHEFLEPARIVPQARLSEEQQPFALRFEREIYIKQNAAWLLEQELRRFNTKHEIGIGTATDPYQPIERRMGVTRSILEVFAERSGYRLGIVTKSTLIARDIDLLQKIAAANHLVIHLTITTTDSALARILEPRAPRPDLRFETVRKLRAAGLIAGVMSSPLLPGITDNPDALSATAARAKEVDASFFCANPLFLKSCSRPTYLSFVREHFPNLVAEYAQRFAKMDFADEDYRQKLKLMVRLICRKHGLAERSSEALFTRDDNEGTKIAPPPPELPAQALLFA